MTDSQGTSPLGGWAFVAVIVTCAVAVTPLLPPRTGASTDPAEFSAGRAFEHIDRIARTPRPIGSAANRDARAYIVAVLRSMGLQPDLQTTTVTDYFSTSGDLVDVVNVVARVPGMSPTGAVALMGHYDTDPETPGANDDASAVAVILETARAILAGPRPDNDVILVFTDGEEPAPRFGSTAFVEDHPWASDIGFVINLETIGSGGPAMLIGSNGGGRWIIDEYAGSVPDPCAFSYLTALNELIGGSNTDFAPFRDAGIAGVEFAYLHGSPIYHTAADAPDRVSLRSLTHQGESTLALARRIGGLDLTASRPDADGVFFTVGRSVVVRYRAQWSWALVALAGLALAAAVRRRSPRGLGRGVGVTLVSMACAAVIATGIWIVVAGWRDTMGVIESYLYLAALFALTAVVGVAAVWWSRRRADPGPCGVVLVWWSLALLITIASPGIGYLFAWPALGAGLVLALERLSDRSWWQLGRLIAVALPTLLLLVPAIDTFYQLAQPRPGNPDSELIPIIALPVMLMAMIVALLQAFWVRRHTVP